jgi:putative transposase
VTSQCQLLDISRSGLYYHPAGISDADLTLMKLIDKQYMATPFYGARKMAVWLKSERHSVNRKHVRRLMQLMGLRAIYRRPRTSQPAPGNKIYPYLLNGLKITRPNQVWCADVTYIPMARGFLYLVVIMDWYSRYVLAWRLSNTLDAEFCVEALAEALRKGRPDIFNTDQGTQFTGKAFTGLLEQHGVNISMDGRGSYNNNLFIERLWRTVKYEEVYLKAYGDGREARAGIGNYFRFYNTQRPHQALGYRTPAEVYFSNRVVITEEAVVESRGQDIHAINLVRMSGHYLNSE